jgi:lipopolysaccharide/colanic/teichoic acid biosynthesis glycosyltransferase
MSYLSILTRKLWTAIIVGSRKAERNEFDRLHSVAESQRILDRERSRAGRSGSPFSLLTLTPRDSETSRATLLHLASYLRRRLRSTDEVGWLDDARIGVVLPDTPASGAWKVADDVCLSFPEDLPPPVVEIYTYPTDEPAGKPAPTDLAMRSEVFDRAPHGTESFYVQPMPPWKRGLDILGASIGLVLLAPLLIVVAVAVKLTSPGPAFFSQKRSGLGGRPFTMYKFRSMRVDAEARKVELMAMNEQDGPAFKIRNDPRVTPIGRLLRSTSIDELPQLWNVLKGDMSLVGPRPLPCNESEACALWQKQRLDVTPGLTCIWQVTGRSAVSFNEWVRMDIQYVHIQSLKTDLKILLQTIPAVLRRKGAV